MYKSVRGMEDILPSKIALWKGIENAARDIFSCYGYQEIVLPVVESTEVFTRTLGEASDIVNKEMYTFPDKKGRSLTLRPEGTAYRPLWESSWLIAILPLLVVLLKR